MPKYILHLLLLKKWIQKIINMFLAEMYFSLILIKSAMKKLLNDLKTNRHPQICYLKNVSIIFSFGACEAVTWTMASLGWAHIYVQASVRSLQACLTPCDPMGCSLPGSSVHGILQAGILKWVGMPSSRGSPPPRDWTLVSGIYLHWEVGSLPLAPPGKPHTSTDSCLKYVQSNKNSSPKHWNWISVSSYIWVYMGLAIHV